MTDIKELAKRLLSFGVTSHMILRDDVHEAANLLLSLQEELDRVKKEFSDFGRYHQQQIREAHYDVDWGGPKNYGDKE